MLGYNLQFFAKDGEGGEKTEEATPKKLEEARKEGQVAKSQDMAVAILLIILFTSLRFFGGYMYDRFVQVFVTYSNSISEYAYDFNSDRVMNLLAFGGKEILMICGPIMALALIAAVAVNVAQVKWKPTGKPMKPKISSGFPRA